MLLEEAQLSLDTAAVLTSGAFTPLVLHPLSAP